MGRGLQSVTINYFMFLSVEETYFHILQASMWTDIAAEKNKTFMLKKPHSYIEKSKHYNHTRTKIYSSYEKNR